MNVNYSSFMNIFSYSKSVVIKLFSLSSFEIYSYPLRFLIFANFREAFFQVYSPCFGSLGFYWHVAEQMMLLYRQVFGKTNEMPQGLEVLRWLTIAYCRIGHWGHIIVLFSYLLLPIYQILIGWLKISSVQTFQPIICLSSLGMHINS